MRYLIGTDEAGYGPNLGPLVISATVWEVPDDVGTDDLYGRLEEVIAASLAQSRGRRPRRSARSNGDGCPHARVVMADSKALYSNGKGVGHLEAGLLPALALLGHRPGTWRDLWHALAPAGFDPVRTIPWLADYDAPVPCARRPEEIEAATEFLRVGMGRAGVRLAALRSRAIFEGEFNDLVDQYQSKGAALSHETLALVTQAVEAIPRNSGADIPVCREPPRPNGRQECLPHQAISIVCDKHGGRNCYGALLDEHFPGHFIEIHGEGPRQSVYRFGPAGRRHDICFRVHGESCLPAALASMASKYLRELAMQAFNDYWRRRVPGLLPTAGYPTDAKRFRADIAEAFRGMDISERALWRQR